MSDDGVKQKYIPFCEIVYRWRIRLTNSDFLKNTFKIRIWSDFNVKWWFTRVIAGPLMTIFRTSINMHLLWLLFWIVCLGKIMKKSFVRPHMGKNCFPEWGGGPLGWDKNKTIMQKKFIWILNIPNKMSKFLLWIKITCSHVK